MKSRIVPLVVLVLLLVTSARAEWRDVKEGLASKAVFESVGRPLIESRTRGGMFVTWTYDNGAYVLFENGRVLYWQAPKPSPLARVRAQQSGQRLASK